MKEHIMMKSASEMKKVAKAVESYSHEMEELTVVAAITSAAEVGLFSTQVDCWISNYLYTKLTSAGYTVNRNSPSYQREPEYTTIAWN